MTDVVILLNRLASACVSWPLTLLAALPGWVLLTLVSALTGVGLLLVFKYTSSQRALKQVRNGIKANLMSLSLFNDNVAVSLRSQGRLLWGAARLLTLSLVPMLVMTVPVGLLLGQLTLWFQTRPLRAGEEAVVSVTLRDNVATMPEVSLAADAAVVTAGPVRVPRERLACWNVRAIEPGCHQLNFRVEGNEIGKELAVGDGFMPVSSTRPSRDWVDVFRFPREEPLPPDSPVQSISVDYPTRTAWLCGSRSWLLYWFAVSTLAAFCVRPLLRIHM
jgi:hypothetical protein